MADEKIIFSMVGVSKTFPNQKRVLNNIYLSFFYGAKIGIIGLNGAGKSTLMKIIAGIDKNYEGEVVFSPGYTVGYLEQEPKLDDSKTVKEVVEEGCAATVALLKEYEEINMKLCEPMDDDTMAKLIERQGELYEQIDHVNGWELDSVLERAMDALRCPDPDQSVKVLSAVSAAAWRCAACCCNSPTCCCSTSPRTTSRRVDRLARTAPPTIQGYGDRRDPRPLLPGQRRRMDPRTGPRRGHSVEGQLLGLARTEDHAHGHGGEAGVETPQDPRRELEWVRMSPLGASRQVEGASVGLRQTDERGYEAEGGEARNLHPERSRVWAMW